MKAVEQAFLDRVGLPQLEYMVNSRLGWQWLACGCAYRQGATVPQCHHLRARLASVHQALQEAVARTRLIGERVL